MTSKTIYVCVHCSNEYKTQSGATYHSKYCESNPEKQPFGDVYKRYKFSCLSCKTELSANQFTKHINSDCKLKTTSSIIDNVCQFCNENLFSLNPKQRSTHVKWCKLNPNRGQGVIGNRPKRIYTEESRNDWVSSLKEAHKRGCYTKETYEKSKATKLKNGTYFPTEETKEKLRISANNSRHQRVCKKTHEYIDKQGRVFKFDSSWEDALADRLDFLNIKWDRPKSIMYEINGKRKQYFPDFYLLDYGLYLDPKNSYAEKQQKTKLDIVSKHINLKILRSKEECINFILE
jgi:hypothetical protein